MTTPTVTEIRRNGNPVGERVELGRYTVPAGERILYGQRVDGVVRFLGEACAVVALSSRGSENSRCRLRRELAEAVRANAARQQRPNLVCGRPTASRLRSPGGRQRLVQQSTGRVEITSRTNCGVGRRS